MLGALFVLSFAVIPFPAGPPPDRFETAVAVWPIEGTDGEASDPRGYTVHMSPTGEPEREITFPAGEWSSPPPGDYSVFLEGAGKISCCGGSAEIYEKGPDGAGQIGVMTVGAAGRARVESPFHPSNDLVAQLIGIDSHSQGASEPLEAFSRRLILDRPEPVVTMPAGKALAAVYSRRAGVYLALSRPFAVEPGGEALARPMPPAADKTDFLLVLERPRRAKSFDEYDLDAALYAGSDKIPADLLIPTAGRVYAVWYGLPAGPARLVVSSRSLYLADRMLELRGGEVESQVLALARRPRLRLQLEVPEQLRRQGPLEIFLKARASTGFTPPKIDAAAKEVLLEGLPPLEGTLMLSFGELFSFEEPIDLRSGEDGELIFAPFETEVSGRLTCDGEGTLGEIAFSLPYNRQYVVKTDADGEYRTWLWQQRDYEVLVSVPQRSKPMRQVVEVPREPALLVDFEVPAPRHRLRAVDRQSRQVVPIKKADYDFTDDAGRLLQGREEAVDGQVELPPFGPGPLTVTVVADDYHDGRLEGLELPSRGADGELTLELDKVESFVHLELSRDLFAEKAAGAEIRVLRDGFPAEVAWEGKSDADGLVRIPAGFAGQVVLVRDEKSAVLVDFLPGQNVAPAKWRLPARPDPDRLTIVAVDEGFQPVSFADVLLGIGPVWLGGPVMSWLAGMEGRGATTNGYGIFSFFGLPEQEISLLVLQGIPADDLSGLAHLAIRIDDPRPQVITIPVMH